MLKGDQLRKKYGRNVKRRVKERDSYKKEELMKKMIKYRRKLCNANVKSKHIR